MKGLTTDHTHNKTNTDLLLLDTTHSNGVYNIECPYFDGISFRWNGKAGVSINIRFNFLSTDFSRIKGVKGIPLRLHVVSQAVATEPAPLERCYCQIKLFRDKVIYRMTTIFIVLH